VGAAVLLSAQQQLPDPASESASFEVASVKPNRSGTSNAVPPSRANGSYSVSNVARKSVIANAYELRIFQIEGPDWLTSERFDIIARGREGTPDRLRLAMLRALLAERFKLAAHFETREQQVYALVLARSDGLGLQLKPSPPSASGATPGPLMTSVVVAGSCAGVPLDLHRGAGTARAQAPIRTRSGPCSGDRQRPAAHARQK
jgi:uncharacterized protein (TIGR03435 family)